MFYRLSEESLNLAKKDFKAFEEKEQIASAEYYNGEAFVVFDDGSVICWDCFKNEIESIDYEDGITIAFNIESDLTFCESCNRLIHPNNYICCECGSVIDEKKNDCCKATYDYLISLGYDGF